MGQGRVNDEHWWRESTERSAHSFLPSFLCFLFISILSFSFLPFFLFHLFLFNHSLSLPFFLLFQGTVCIHLDHINVIIIIHCICMWTTSKREERERERKKKKESLKALHYHYNHKNICIWIGGGVAQDLLTVQSTRTYYTHYLMDFVYYYQLHWMTVNLLDRIWVY